MKTSYLISLFFLVACNDNTAPDALVKASAKINDKNAKAKSVYVPPAKYGAEGFYTGEFTRLKYDENKETFNNQVTICIDSLDASQVYGHSIVAGNERPFQGSYKKVNDYYQAQASEPGDHPNDGRFEFTIDTRERKIRGNWFAASNQLSVTERTFELDYHVYEYNPAWTFPMDLVGSPIYGTDNEKDESETFTGEASKINASMSRLTAKDVENLYKGDLELIRNTIYARHGYSFKNLRMRTLFDNMVKWYMPVASDVTSQLTEVEKQNIALIKRYEKHAEKYYDSFGR